MITYEDQLYPPLTSGLGRRSGALLLVDDEPNLLRLGRTILADLNLRIETADSGETALKQLFASYSDGTLPDIVLLDLTMPGGLSGLETLDRIRNSFASLPVVACSGFFDDGAEEVCRRVGFTDVLPKPFTPEALLTTVRRVLARAGE